MVFIFLPMESLLNGAVVNGTDNYTKRRWVRFSGYVWFFSKRKRELIGHEFHKITNKLLVVMPKFAFLMAST
jgi:hypothetical protein